MTPDPFGTEALRRAVLEAWRSSPTRLREDANTEEDHAHGSYRGRVVVELAQNAADAATRAGVPGRVHLGLRAPSGPEDPWVLRVASTGAPLDAAGVASLAAMRASATGSGASGATVGRFGVGFAALRSVADEIRIGSGERAVEFSLARTRAVLAGEEALASEVGRRGDRLPVLRLPFPARTDVPAGYDTVVEAVLRDDEAVAAVRSELADVGDALLLALPALAEVVVDDTTTRRVADVADRWTVLRRSGTVDAALLADRPVEERTRTGWSVVWALPRGSGTAADAAPDVVHAPTPTEEPSSFPALLVASFPLDPSRRHVSSGALADHVARRAGEVYAELLASVAPERGARVLELVPTGLPRGAVDAAVRDAAVRALATTPLLPSAAGDEDGSLDGGADLLRPDRARLLAGDVGSDARLLAALGGSDLVAVPPALAGAAWTLGVQVVDLGDVVDALPTSWPPARWAALYDAVAPWAGDRRVVDALGAVPVPLADGRTVRGPRGLLLLDDGGSGARDLADLGLRVVDSRAAHPLLERLGARTADVRTVAADPAVRAHVLAAARDAEDGEDVVDRVDRLLGLAAAVVAGHEGSAARVGAVDAATVGALPFWWGELPLVDASGERAPARSLALDGSWAARSLDLDLVDADVAARWGEEVLRAVGVAVGPTVLRVHDVLTPLPGEEPDLRSAEPEGWLPDWDAYLAHLGDVLGPGVFVGDVVAVADLDAVPDDAWPGVLADLAADPGARAALLQPVRAPGGAGVAASYTAWWLTEELGGPFALGGVPFLRPVPPALHGLDDDVLVALGGVRDLGDVEAARWPELLDGLGPVGSRVPAEDALALWRALAVLAERGEQLDPAPDRVPAIGSSGVPVVAEARDVVVAPDPRWAPSRPVVPVPPSLVDDAADLLDVDVPPQDGPDPDGPGTAEPVPAGAARALPGLPSTWWRHGRLTVAGVVVPWWVVGDGERARVHAVDVAGLAAGLAAASGRFAARHVLVDVLTDALAGGDVDAALARSAWDSPAGAG
ncbi:sacsin N-terminal ATP-binding-like domain-containing protein [Cellulosimicrobium marinum]|uniref:sacsin N-terminal ATP-binding-like domain-containing protein n=1 Tax=Cellulosimicrobium marinum TaxID=1638992 RepID=UPI001E3E0852|nr:ATP-binding protein [Cellulosimicrobium marinum]MCB7136938.1 ATP-binding protein [Cellulosimicrobium marinum]